MQWHRNEIMEVLPGVIPLLVTSIAIVTLFWQLSCLVRRRKFIKPLGYLALAFSQGCVGIIGMIVASFFYDLKPKFSPKEFSTFVIVFTTFGATLTLAPKALFNKSGFWPNIFIGADRKLPLNSRIKNLIFSVGTLSAIYGGLFVLNFYGPQKFTPNIVRTSKARLGELMLGQMENLLTWAWAASALLGMLVALSVFVLFFEIVQRKHIEHK